MVKSRSLTSTDKWRYDEPTPTKAIPPETPVHQRSTTRPVFQASNATSKKETVYDEVYPAIKPVSDDIFFGGILPPLPKNLKLDHAIKTLKKIGIITDGRLKFFPQNPSEMAGVENDVFKKLEEMVIDVVQTMKGKSRKPTMRFICNPDGVPFSSNRTNLSRPDGYLLTLDSGNDVKWISIAIPAEYKKYRDPGKRHDNDLKTIWSIYHCMCEDPRKRFIISFTIEDNMMRLWFCNRELFLVSNEFDFIKDYRKTVHFFISVMFAKDHQLGWDPTMVRDRKSDTRFKILVRDQNNKASWYGTEALLSDMGAESLFGRATRVWSARKLNRNGKPIGPVVVLKDSWIDADRIREGDIYRQIRQHSQTRQYLLEVLCSGDVYLKEAKEWDHTRIQAMKEAILPRMGRTVNGRFISTVKEIVTKVTGAILTPRIPHPSVLSTYPRFHHRLVLNGVYTPLTDISHLEDVFRALAESASAVYSLHAARWVHRDLTPANILTHGSGTDIKVKLADIEYSKSMDSNTGHTVRSGFCEFRAIEAVDNTYQFRHHIHAKATTNEPIGSRLPKATVSEAESNSAAQPTIALDNPQFRYNPLHDYESLWWIGVNSVVDKEIHDGDEVLTVCGEQRAWADKLFYSSHSDLDRMRAFAGMDTFKRIVESLHPSIRAVGSSLDSLRKTLYAAYQLAEEDLSKAFDMSLAEEAVSNVNELFVKLADSIKDRNMTVHPIPPPSASRKRKEFDEDDSPSTFDDPVSASPRPAKKANRG